MFGGNCGEKCGELACLPGFQTTPGWKKQCGGLESGYCDWRNGHSPRMYVHGYGLIITRLMKPDTLRISRSFGKTFCLTVALLILFFGTAEGVTRTEFFQAPLTPLQLAPAIINWTQIGWAFKGASGAGQDSGAGSEAGVVAYSESQMAATQSGQWSQMG